MKKIYYRQITSNPTSVNGYSCAREYVECEYSEEWFADYEDPIIPYVENAMDDMDGYTWDEPHTVYYAKGHYSDGEEHFLFYDHVPVAMYFVLDIEE